MITQTNKVAIITGASGGIGAAVAERLAKNGFTVVVNYAGNAASAQAVVARIEAAGGSSSQETSECQYSPLMRLALASAWIGRISGWPSGPGVLG